MRIIYLMFTMVLCVSMQSQIVERVTVEGEVVAPPGDEVQGINVVNKTTNEGVITDAKGTFRIRVGINDRLEVTAIQFQKFTIIVDEGVVESKELHVFVSESVNQLEEVVVTPYDLSGNIRADIQRIKADKKIDAPVLSAAKISDDDYSFSSDNQSRLDNVAVGGRRVRGELNFVNVFKALWETTHKRKKAKQKDEDAVDYAVRKMYNDQFFKDHLALEIEEINEFMVFAETKGLNETMLEAGKELDLIEFLMEQGAAYRKQ